MSMCGYMTKEDKEEWYQKNRQAQIDSAEAWKQEQEAKTGGRRSKCDARADVQGRMARIAQRPGCCTDPRTE